MNVSLAVYAMNSLKNSFQYPDLEATTFWMVLRVIGVDSTSHGELAKRLKKKDQGILASTGWIESLPKVAQVS